MQNFLFDMKNRVLNGEKITKDEALKLFECEFSELLSCANEIRKHFCKDEFDLCTIINAKSGKCSEDCKYCAQSAHFNTGCKTYEMIDKEEALKISLDNQKKGAHRISLVSSGRGLKENSKDMPKVEEIYKYLSQNCKLSLCASFGIASKEALVKLKNCGVKTYHHNLETSRNYFSKICTTHSYEERIQTIKFAKEAGLEICSGGIFGMGESVQDRIDMALDLRELGVKSVPINILTPIPGTPFENLAPVDEKEILKCIAIFRFILPDVFLRFAGGRKALKNHIKDALNGGVNSALTGDFLTTAGDSIKDDIDLITQNGFNVRSI